MGSKDFNRQVVIDIDASTTPTLLQVLRLAKQHAPGFTTVEALQKYYADHIDTVKQTQSPELWYRLRMAAQLITVVSQLDNDFHKSIYNMN